MFDHSILGKAAGLISFIGFVPYIWGIVKGHVKPSGTSWTIWTLIGASLYLSYSEMNQNDDSIWVPLSYVIGPLIIMILCIWYGDKNYGRLDIFCLILSLSSLSLGYILHNFKISLLANIFADCLGAFPTLKKSCTHPESEDLTAWLFFWVGNSLNLFVLENIFQIEALYPLYLFSVSAIISVLLIIGKYKNKTNMKSA